LAEKRKRVCRFEKKENLIKRRVSRKVILSFGGLKHLGGVSRKKKLRLGEFSKKNKEEAKLQGLVAGNKSTGEPVSTPGKKGRE